MAKPTIGPWFADIGETAVVRDKSGNQIAMFTHLHTKTGGRRDADEVSANTRLAAAAPDLLAALEHVLGFCTTRQGMEGEMAIDDARKLIARLSPQNSGEP